MREVPDISGETFPVHVPDISDWATITAVTHPEHGQCYVASVGDQTVGELRYIVDFPEPGLITVGGLWTDPDYRGRGIARCLIIALHAGHPGQKISPGAPSADGLGFVEYLLAGEPTVRAEVALIHPTVAHLSATPG